ncbi:hypothetical protein [Halobellus sp. H-GB7]|uniref:hypothetical protein n=1 Tax=Halobellus sp. H-GB7 TaxID=3069756 RepID=UPI0027B246FA|nr:hypothetical protein [Halobellus sp. H-GB7]MDQ2055608.1 hypothetical protein [Halobellus sp. H-GB7]
MSTDTGDADSNLYLHTDRSTGRYRWQLTFEDAIGDARTYRFATVINRAQNSTAGTVLVDTTFGGGFTKGFLGASERDLAAARLVMQRPNE